MRRLVAILAADVVGYSRLVSVDEAGALARLAALRGSIIEPSVAAHSGRLFKIMGDGFLVEFASAVQAASCAIAIQKETEAVASAVDDAKRMRLRIGIHVGDVLVEGEDLLGDGVNIAARLEGIAEPGTVCISRQVYDQIEGKLPLVCRSLGPQRLKNISKSIDAYAIGAAAGDAIEPGEMELKVNYCRAPDGVRLAYAIMGSGSPLVKTANWMNHLEFDWQNPDLHHLYTTLARDFTLLRYDARGNGLSDWDVEDISLDAWVRDLEAVVDAAGFDRFPLLGLSQGCAISVAFAVRHPERVTHLVLYGGFARGAYRRAKNDSELQQAKALATLIRTGWGGESRCFVSCSHLCLCRVGHRSSFKDLRNANARRRRPSAPTVFSKPQEAWTLVSCCPRSAYRHL